MARFTLERRAFLRGASGTAIALPFLEIMAEGKGRAASVPKAKLVFVYAGISQIGWDGDFGGTTVRYLTPKNEGPNYDLPRDLTPLGRDTRQGLVRPFQGCDVQSDVSIVSGCSIPWGEQPPADGRALGFHGSTMAPLLSGTAASSPWRAPSVENLVGRAFGGDLRFRSLQLQVQASSYEGDFNQRGDISFDVDSNGRVVGKSFTASPRQAWSDIFGKGSLPTADLTPEQKKAQLDAQQIVIDRNRSVLDTVMKGAARLRMRVGRYDQLRLDRHLAEIRDLEKLVTTIPDLNGSSYCKKPDDPRADPGTDPALTSNFNDNVKGWSNEEDRAKAMRGLMYMALTCGLTRAGCLLISYAQTYINAKYVAGVDDNMHGWSHHPSSTQIFGDIVAWHVEQFADLARMLKSVKDVDGTSTMLDNTVLLMGTEGGGGYDPDGKEPVSAHSSEGMSVLVAGGRNLGFNKVGRHIPKGNKAHPASVIRSAMKAVGVDRPLGAVDTLIPELFEQ